MIRLYAVSTGEVTVQRNVQFGSIMVKVGEGSFFLDVQDARDLIAALQEVLDGDSHD